MALVVTGQASPNGKLNDVVFYESRWGKVARTNFTPANPQSTKQTLNRVAFGDAASLWNGLTPFQKGTWENKYGSRSYQSFISINRNRMIIGKPALVMPVFEHQIRYLKDLDKGISTVLKLNIHWEHADGSITLAPNEYMLISATQPRASHARCPDPWYRIVSILPPGTVSPFDIMPDYLTEWNPVTPIVDKRIMVQAILMDGDAGAAAPPVYTSALTV